MPFLAWVLIITAIDPQLAPKIPPERSFATQAECNAEREAFIKAHMYNNWQGLTMSPLIRTICQYQ